MKTLYLRKMVIAVFLIGFAIHSYAQYQLEKLNRGVVAVRSGNDNFVSWRFMGTEEDNVTFNLYRGTTKVNATPLNVTNYTDVGAATNAQYSVKAVVNGVEQAASETVSVWGQQYLSIPLQIPAGGTTPVGEAYTYNANDCSVGDVDGDGVYELFLKWDPSNSKDNSQSGYTGNVYIDCYRLNGTRLWRIDLGRNIRAGAHYTQFQVYDFNGDGKAEMMVKTSDGTRDGAGTIIGNANADYRNSSGYILTGNEFLTVFNGLTGAAMATVNYLPARGTVSAWGDSYGNRVDRFNAGVAYLDGKKPSAVFCRGYYTRLTVATWDWNGTTLTNRWLFDTGNSSSNAFYGQGNHSISIADVDSDGKQEIITGAAVIDDNGTGLYSTGFGHGDAGHVSDFDPTNPGLEVFNIQERDDDDDCYLYSPGQKRVIWKKGSTGGEGPGRGVMANITDQFAGAEGWVGGGQTTGGPWQINGTSMGTGQPSSVNFLMWWDGDLPRELNNGTTIDKYGTGRILTASGTSSNNGTKSTPCLSGDILGDWREELIVRTSDNTALRLYTTTNPTTYKIRTLLHDAQYRVALAWQNSSYNQPPHPSFFLGAGVALPPKPNITIVGGPVNIAPTVSITAPVNNASFTAPAVISIAVAASDADGTISNVQFFNGTTLLGTDATSPYSFSWGNVAAGTYSITAKATDNGGTVSTSSVITITVINPPVITSVIQAETACSVTGIFNESTNAGFNGTGYVNTANQVGSSVEYSINSPTAQSVTLSLRYANAGTTTRNTSVSVNGTIQVPDVSYTSTSAWTSWSSVSVSVTLASGNNILQFVSLTADGGPNLDELVFGVSGITSATCPSTPPVNQAPTVSITAPSNNSSFTAPASISISATASDADGTVSGVQFFQGTTLLGTDAISPYTFSWANIAAGTYSITAKATDNSGAVTTSSAITITVTTVTPPPAGDITGPDCGTKNTAATFELSAANKANATSYSWWFTGSSQSLTPVSGDPSKVVISYGSSFTGGDLCIGVNYSVSPWFKQYCKTITLCTARMDASSVEDLLEVQTATVAPNPSTGSFIITVPEEVSAFKIMDNLGSTVYSRSALEEGESIIFGEQLASGLYAVYIRYASGREEIRRVQKIK